jgi:hypothetical protein
MKEEILLLETDRARYIAVARTERVEITGGVNTDITLQRVEKTNEQKPASETTPIA